MTVAIQFRPLDVWPGVPTPSHSRQRSRFAAPYTKTVKELARELDAIGAKNVVILADCDESEIRRDGMIRSDARLRGPGIVVCMDSKYGALKYPCDKFTQWESNLRAIALSMEALRKVDRYGVTKRGEQYTGWKQLPSSATPAEEWASVEQAFRFLCVTGDVVASAFTPPFLQVAYRAAARKAHPDAGGSTELMSKVNRANDYIERATT